MSSRFSYVDSISSQELANEWDCLASERHQQIFNGLDITFTHVMAPLVESLVGQDDEATLVDIGSGTGELTGRLAARFKKVVCVEPSLQSINIAKSILSFFSNIEFINSDFEDCETHLKSRTEKNVFLAAMMLSADPQLDKFAQTLSRVAQKGDEFVATIPHPCFWPRYWGYEKESWFSYSKELMIKAPFKISLSDSEFKTTHIHRPIERYIVTFAKYGFQLASMSEPIPNNKVQSLYPKKWEFPRFLAFKWIKSSPK
ncbi:methyltransferase domain-containing protein [Pseudomonas yamanorum]|uniref:class I SAM-dependent methyltransferase n=1 Tax=Pseudomonas TaxID=286 RepID=UPI0015A1F865|nr:MULTISPECIES: methyltransferase domain-containing protein [Pseudomonas]NWA76612.1 methyltransferase domain-containing protein [Pseudomonas sp. C8002]NWE40785.1 methyltransferase domain-containing protein [Pseudomonas yamanorum]